MAWTDEARAAAAATRKANAKYPAKGAKVNKHRQIEANKFASSNAVNRKAAQAAYSRNQSGFAARLKAFQAGKK